MSNTIEHRPKISGETLNPIPRIPCTSMYHPPIVLSDRDRVGEHIEGRPKVPSKASIETGPQNHKIAMPSRGDFVMLN